jgi:tetratricopeptide (TPR) repeat protein
VALSTKQLAKFDTALQEALDYRNAGRLSEAEQVYRSILKRRPSHPGANSGLAHTLNAQGKALEAEALHRRVVAVAPNSADAHNDLAIILFAQGKIEEAAAACRTALALDPEMAEAHINLALALSAQGLLSESHAAFKRHAALVYGKPGIPAGPALKIQHDQEQRQYLESAGSDANAAADLAGERVAGRAVNPDVGDRIAALWQTSSPQFVVVDNFLTDEALNRIRRYCWGAPVWKFANSAGYIRALPEHGFACPLLLQIDEEMRSVYQTILKQLPLNYWWAFKYETERLGTHVHADFAAVNVNYWIAPDEANLDANTGGLIIWDKPAPLEWGYKEYNCSPQAARDFLKQSSAKSITVPHRGNRAVIFNSNLFHETDKISFKDGYMNKRINITMLYGKRDEQSTAPGEAP